MGSCVRGVQLATTTRLSSCSSIFSRMSVRLSLEHVYMVSVAYSTPGSCLAYSATFSTSITPAMLLPQWQTKTPTRGSSPTTSLSAGYSLSTVSVPRESARPVITWAAAAEAWATESGMSLGSPNGPTTKTPLRLVSSGLNSCSSQKPCRLRATPTWPAASCALRAGSRPAESTTMS